MTILPPCDKSPQRFQLTILRARCAGRATARRWSRRGSTRDLLRRDGSQASPGRRLDLIEGGNLRRLSTTEIFGEAARTLYFNGEW